MRPEAPPEPGKRKALILALLTHGLLVAVLFFGVQWKRSVPDVVEVELWSASPPPPQPEPQPEPKPEPPKPEPKPEVKPEPKPPVKPDIVEKVEKKPPKKPEVKPEPPKPEPKKPDPPKPPPPKPEAKPEPRRPDFSKQLEQEEQQRKTAAAQANAAKNAEHELQRMAQKGAMDKWQSAIRQKIRGNVVLPPNIQGNPEAVFDIRVLPTGEIMQPLRRTRSSGNANLDDAIERAIIKSSPLPKPEAPAQIPSSFEIKYRPFEE